MVRTTTIAAMGLLFVGCAGEVPPPDDQRPSSYVYVWAADADDADTDFLAAVDVREGSETYGEVVATVPVGATGIMAHHTELQLGDRGLLFANAFNGDRTWVFDVSTLVRRSFTRWSSSTYERIWLPQPISDLLSSIACAASRRLSISCS